jgi:hypothetical protein
VVLSAIRVIMIFMRYIKSEEFIKGLIKKMSPPLGRFSFLDFLCGGHWKGACAE